MTVIAISEKDYARLLEAAGLDDMIVWCERCGAWLERDDHRVATTDDFTGCWFAATLRDEDRPTCVREQRPASPDWRP